MNVSEELNRVIHKCDERKGLVNYHNVLCIQRTMMFLCKE